MAVLQGLTVSVDMRKQATMTNNNRQVEKLAYSVTEVMDVLGMSRATVNVHLQDGTIPSVKIGGRRLIPRAALEQLLVIGDGD